MKSKAIGFVAFVRALGVKPTPAQAVLFEVACDGVQPSALDGERRELARSMFGDVDEVPTRARDVVDVVKGARIGGSYFCALRLLHEALTLPLGTLAPGEVASALIVGPDLRLARQSLRYALGAAKANDEIARRIEAETSDSFTLRRDDGRAVVIECLPASRGGSALRGRSLVGVQLTECAFFRDESFAVNDVDIFRAVAPRVLPGGQILIESTPWGQSGLLYDLFAANHGKPMTALAAHCPTLLMRPDARTRGVVERERQRDPANAAREFDAEWMSGGSAFFNAEAIDRCIELGRTLDLAPMPDAPAYCGADFGFRSDSSALAIVQVRGDVMTLARLEEMTPTKGHPLQPGAVVGRFAEIAKPFGQRNVAADGHYAEAIREHLATHGLSLVAAPEGTKKVATYLHARELINAGRLRLHDDGGGVCRRLIVQLRAIVAKPTSGGMLQITAPRRAGGGHGDLVSALVLACWQARRATSIATFEGLPTSVGPRPMQW